MNKYVLSEDLTRAEVSLPGLRVADVERNGACFSAWRISRLFQTVGYGAVTAEPLSLANLRLLGEEVFTFTKSYWHRVTAEFYTLPDHCSLLKCAASLSYVGRSSLQFHTAVFKDGAIAAESIITQVCVNKVSRHPRPLPQWWTQQFKPPLPKDAKLEVFDFVETPQYVKIFTTMVVCAYEDIDSYKHMCNANYTRHCLNAACEAAQERFFSALSGNIFCQHVKEMRQLYISQWSLGEKSNIELWENPTNPFVVHFNVIRNGKIIYQNTITFFDNISNYSKL